MRSVLVCPSCETQMPGLSAAPLPFSCPGQAERPAYDHVLRRKLSDITLPPIESSADEKNPFLRFRGLDHVYLAAREAGLSDTSYVALVRRLNDAVLRLVGRGFVETPLEERLIAGNTVFLKNETENVSGCHKVRHLFPVLVHLEVVKELGLADPSAELVIASCGNAALAASILAQAAGRPLRVFVPEDAERSVVDTISSLGAAIEVCPRQPGIPGDPTYARFRQAVRSGAVPFSCQGGDQALAVQGGKSLAWELAFSDAPCPDRVFVQVGGGALASSLFSGLEEAVLLGRFPFLPRLHPVQTAGCFPLVRAYRKLVADIERARGFSALDSEDARALRLRDVLGPEGILRALDDAAKRRHGYMWPWETTPHSLAHGILDDETYDWIGVLRGTLLSGGTPVLLAEEDVEAGYEMARRETGISVCPTGAAAFSGYLSWLRTNNAIARERVFVPLTGKQR